MLVFKESSNGQVMESIELVCDFLKVHEFEVGDILEIEALEMTKSEFENLPEL